MARSYHIWTIRIPSEYKDKVEQLASEKYKSVNKYVVDLLIKKINKSEKNGGESSDTDIQEMLEMQQNNEALQELRKTAL